MTPEDMKSASQCKRRRINTNQITGCMMAALVSAMKDIDGIWGEAVRKGLLEEVIFKLIQKVREQLHKETVEEHSRQETQDVQGLQGSKSWLGSKLERLEGG